MKKNFLLAFLLANQLCFAKPVEEPPYVVCAVSEKDSSKYNQIKPTENAATLNSIHSHNKFHFEFGIGPAFGSIADKYNTYDINFTGTGAGIELKIGGALKENLFLTFDILSKAIVSPEIKNGGNTYLTSNDLSISEVTYGAGLTYYAMPTDIFCSATVGAGAFVINDGNKTSRSKYGFSTQIKAGKHWWVSKQWGLSLGVAYGFTSVNNSDEKYNSYNERLRSNRFTIVASIGIH